MTQPLHESQPHSCTIRVPDDWDALGLTANPWLRERLGSARAPGTTVNLDLTGVRAIDSSTFALLMAADVRLQAEDIRLMLTHVDERVAKVLRITGIGRRLHVLDGPVAPDEPAARTRPRSAPAPVSASSGR